MTRAFLRVSRMPRDEGMEIVTRWRWDVTRAGWSPELENAALEAIKNVEIALTRRGG